MNEYLAVFAVVALLAAVWAVSWRAGYDRGFAQSEDTYWERHADDWDEADIEKMRGEAVAEQEAEARWQYEQEQERAREAEHELAAEAEAQYLTDPGPPLDLHDDIITP